MLPSTTAFSESACEKQILDASPDVLCLDTECRSEQGYSKQTGNAIELCVQCVRAKAAAAASRYSTYSLQWMDRREIRHSEIPSYVALSVCPTACAQRSLNSRIRFGKDPLVALAHALK